MRNRTLGALGALLALTVPTISWAYPSAYTSECGALTIENETSATLLRDNRDCKLIWVLPPGAGYTQFTGYTPSGNLGFCGEVKSAQGMSARVMERMEETNKQIDDRQEEFQRANRHLVEATKEKNELLKDAQIGQLERLQAQLIVANSAGKELMAQLSTCTNNCDTLVKEYENIVDRQAKLTEEIENLRATYFQTVKLYDRANAKIKAAELEMANVGKDLEEIQKKQMDFHKLLLDNLVVYSRFEGGFAHLDYNTGWDEAIATLEAKYGNRYQFRKIDTKEARVFANIVGAANEQSYLSSMPAILDYSINGTKYLPFGDQKDQMLAALPTQMTGSIRMSLMGGCPLYYKDFLESDRLTPAEGIPQSYNFGISATYSYPSAYKLKMTASYNLYKFYEKIVESSSRGGFFSSRSTTSITENKIDRDAFNIDWEVEDPDSIYNETKRAEIATALKQELVGRVLGTMAQPVFGAAPNLSAPVQGTGDHGAVVLANGLQSTCGNVNVYCAAGVWILRGLDAIFGSNSATSTYRATHDRTATETWDVKSVNWKAGAMVFPSKQQQP